MLYKSAFKWLTITIIALTGFLIVLLFLGYLLKENEAATTQLKAKLEQEAYQQQEKENRKSNPSFHFPITLTPLEKSQQKIIANNRRCHTNKQCFLVHTHKQALGCIVAVNTAGAAILLRVLSEKEDQHIVNKQCMQEYEKQGELLAQCRNSMCSF